MMNRIARWMCLASLTSCGTAPSATPTVDAAVTPADASEGCAAPAPDDPLVVRVEHGLLRGAAESDAIRWLGIPYAAPPLGERRWQPPAPLTACWREPRDATAWAPACAQVPQSQTTPFDPDAPIAGQEDCLTLNVWRPAANGARPRPVMVFVHGGGNVIGSADETSNGQRLYDGARLAARGDVVVVTLQYRLGPLGWLAHPALPDTANLALMDQRAALRWVQRNIGAFGGDPARVMLFGESAGATNVCALLTSPDVAGLFTRAAVQSGSCLLLRSPEDAAAQALRFTQRVGCEGAADLARCLRDLPLERVLRALPAPVSASGLGNDAVRWGPSVAPGSLAEVPYDALRGGRHARVPILVGHNREEVALSVPAIATEEVYRMTLRQLFGDSLAARVAEIYSVARFRTPRAALVQAATDARFGCQARAVARAAFAGSSPVWRYLFAQPLESGTPAARALGAWHGLELLYVFQHIARFGAAATPGDLAVERQVLQAWTAFAANGVPASPEVWPGYAPGREPTLRIDASPAVEDGWRNPECDGWDTVLAVAPPPP